MTCQLNSFAPKQRSMNLAFLALIILIFAFIQNCSREKQTANEERALFFGPQKLMLTENAKNHFSISIESKNFEYFNKSFILIIDNLTESRLGNGVYLTLLIDGKEILSKTDLGSGKNAITRRITLSAGAQVDIDLEGVPGSIIEFSIRGQLKDNYTSDIDGNIYKTVKIGNQVWMAENLRVTRLNDGTVIPEVKAALPWTDLKTPGYCWYNNDSTANAETYGALYNFYAINSGNLAPKGWHIPKAEDFMTLIRTVDPSADFKKTEVSLTAGEILKLTGVDGKNFNALPAGGCRSSEGDFFFIDTIAYFGGSTDQCQLSVREVSDAAFFRNKISPYVGVSVRCIRDY